MGPFRPKTCYHPFILIAFHLNCLPDNLLGCIPKFKRFDWAHRNFQDSFGFNWYLEKKEMFLTLKLISQHKSLLKINRAFLRVIAIRVFLKKYSAASAVVSESCKMAVVGNIQKVSQVLGLKKTLRCVDLDFKNYAGLRKSVPVIIQYMICAS